MKLKLGKMTNQELAEWFGISEKGFSNKRPKKLVDLKNYAKFSVGRGYVTITEIIIDEYDPKMTTNKEKVAKLVDKLWDQSGLDTCINVARKIKKELDLSLSEYTICKYVRESRNVLYGKPSVEPFVIEPKGKIGSCAYLWCKKGDIADNDNICKYYFLTTQEEEIKEKLLEKYYGSAEANRTARSIADSLLKDGTITKVDYYDTLNELTGTKENAFKFFIDELRSLIGGYIVRGTLVTRDNEEGYYFIEDGTDIEAPIE